MSDASQDDTLDELMARWEDMRRQGPAPSPEELCADQPQMVDALRRRIDAVKAMEHILGVTESATPSQRGTILGMPTSSVHDEPLPSIAGYEVMRLIGHGGMGVVYEARQLSLGRVVAIKMISVPHARPKLLARFRAEAEAAARLQHPNIVHIFDVGQVNGRPFFSMEHVAGGTLADWLERHRPQPAEAAEFVATLAQAVHAAHQNGIVHRDLKPANVLLQRNAAALALNAAIPKIADFGLAKRLDDDSGHTGTGEVLGTPSYMAPEQAEGLSDAIGPATDVYALGAILYELLTGRPPFQGGGALETLRQIAAADPTPPSRIVPTVPRDLEAICLKCLEKAPAHRYASATALADDLHRFLEGAPVLAHRLGALQRAWKRVRQHPQTMTLTFVLGAFLLIPIAFWIVQVRAEQQLRVRARAHAPFVREILHRNCFECHGGHDRRVKKNLHVLDHADLVDPERRIVVPGAPDDSLLIQRIADGSMPPEEDEVRLPRVSEMELTILRGYAERRAVLEARGADEGDFSHPLLRLPSPRQGGRRDPHPESSAAGHGAEGRRPGRSAGVEAVPTAHP